MSKLKSKLILSILFALIITKVSALDTVKVLSKDAFLSIVRTYHPVIKQAGLLVQNAKAGLLQSRGAFDPTLNLDIDRKTFSDKLYYSYFNPQINIPTWYGVDIKAGLEEVIGDRVSSESTFGQSSYLGVKIATNSIFYYKRRATLQQAQILRKQSEAERRLLINDLLYEAISTYWNWVKEYQNYKIISDAILVNENRYRLLKLEYRGGGRPAIDTTEALAQLQNFYLVQSVAKVAYQNAGLELSNYLWLEDNQPVNWDNEVLPDLSNTNVAFDNSIVSNLITYVEKATNHPKLQSISYKVDNLSIEKKLKAQFLLPKINVNANLLNSGYDMFDGIRGPLSANNKVSVDFALPLFLREARGGYKSAKIKLMETDLEKSKLSLQIENKVKMYYNEFIALQNQVEIFSNAYTNYERLYRGEIVRFEIGESSLFLLNSRENKLLEASQKLVELKNKLNKTYAALIWSTGQLQ